MVTVKSVFGKAVALDSPTVVHVLRRHPETTKLGGLKRCILLTVSSPDYVLAGRYGENIAARMIRTGAFRGKWLVVPYDEGGRVKTAFIVSDVERLIRGRVMLWKR